MNCSAEKVMTYSKGLAVSILALLIALAAVMLPKQAFAAPAEEEPYPVKVSIIPQVSVKNDRGGITFMPLKDMVLSDSEVLGPISKLFQEDHDITYIVKNQDGKALKPNEELDKKGYGKHYIAMSTDIVYITPNPETVPAGYHFDHFDGRTFEPVMVSRTYEGAVAPVGELSDIVNGEHVFEMYPAFSTLDVYFDAMDGAFPDGTQLKKARVNNHYKLDFPEQPVKEGYKFDGWVYRMKTKNGIKSYPFTPNMNFYQGYFDGYKVFVGNTAKTPHYTRDHEPTTFDGEYLVEARYSKVLPSSLGPVDDVVATEKTEVSIPVPSENIAGKVKVTLPEGLSGLSFDGTKITGTLPAVSDGNGKDVYTVSVTATGEDGKTHDLTFTITVGAHGEIGPHSPKSYYVGDDAIINLTYKNIEGDLSVTFPDELSGLTYANGQIKGKLPDTIKGDKQDFEIALSGVGYDGKTVTDTLYLTVQNKLVIDQLTDRTFVNGDEVKIPVYVSPASVDAVGVQNMTPLPAGLKFVFDSHGRQIVGTTAVKFASDEEQKVFPVTIVAKLGDLTEEMTFNITVKNPDYVAPENPDNPDNPDKPGKPTGGDTSWTDGGRTYVTPGNADRFPLGKVRVVRRVYLPKTSDVANVAAVVVGLAGLTLGAFGVMRRKVQ